MRLVFAGGVAVFLLLSGLAFTPAQAADIASFTNSCSGSAALKAMFPKAGDRLQPDMDSLCKCVADAIAPTATPAQLDLLVANVSGTMTHAQKDAYNNDDTTQELGMNALNGCLASTGVDKDYGG
jgi:hypothetical protein